MPSPERASQQLLLPSSVRAAQWLEAFLRQDTLVRMVGPAAVERSKTETRDSVLSLSGGLLCGSGHEPDGPRKPGGAQPPRHPEGRRNRLCESHGAQVPSRPCGTLAPRPAPAKAKPQPQPTWPTGSPAKCQTWPKGKGPGPQHNSKLNKIKEFMRNLLKLFIFIEFTVELRPCSFSFWAHLARCGAASGPPGLGLGLGRASLAPCVPQGLWVLLGAWTQWVLQSLLRLAPGRLGPASLARSIGSWLGSAWFVQGRKWSDRSSCGLSRL